MGCGCSSSEADQVPQPGSSHPRSSTHAKYDTCAQCGLDGHRKMATWWCEDCHAHICNHCAWNHSNSLETVSHQLIPAEYLPKPKPTRPAWQTRAHTKQAMLSVYFDTRTDIHYVDINNYGEWNQCDGEEHVRGTCLLPEINTCFCRKRYATEVAAVITGCAFVPGGYIAVTDSLNDEVKLFNAEFHCTAYVKLDDCKPTDICALGNDLYVTLENRCKIQKLGVSLPVLCMGRKLSVKNIIKTEGNCDSIAVYRKSRFTNGLVVGMTFSDIYRTKKYQVHIMDLNGHVTQTLYYNSAGKSLFLGKVFVSGTPRLGEIIVSDSAGVSVQGFDIRGSGEITFNHTVREPLGLSVDRENNIYVITNSCFYWIPPHRETVVPFLKRGHRSKSSNCCYDNKTQILAVTSSHSETVQLYQIISCL